MKTKNPDYRVAVEHIFTAANFINLLGIKFRDTAPGYCEADMDLTADHRQHLGRIHGGAIVTLAGHAATGAVTSLIPADKVVVAIEYKINLFRSVGGEKLFSVAKVIMPGNTLLVAEAEVFDGTGATGKLVAKATFTFMTVAP
jgi:uncharacterized protein (TIGR00369 family)